jgi:molybdate transport system substrate-binding protein
MKFKFKLILSCTFLLLGNLQQGMAATLPVAVAANMQYAFDEIRLEFKNETGHELQATFNSSGKLVAQIINGAPFEVFLSADMDYPEYLNKQGMSTGPARAYAYGTLVLWSRRQHDLSDWKSLLSSDKIKKIALANPKTAPYGREAMKVLEYYQLDSSLKSRLVFGDSISQTNQYIHSGVADIGFTAKSVVSSAQLKGQGHWIEIPPESYQAIAQGAVIIKHGKEPPSVLAQQFYDFLYSNKARMIFQKNGYRLP